MFHDEVALITGSSRGIGRSVAERLHREGMTVALTARSGQALRELESDLRRGPGAGEVLVVPGDVTDPDSVAQVVQATEDAFGAIDLLVNNAGTAEGENVTVRDADPEEWWQVFETNLRGPMLFCRAVASGMSVRGRGRIININSTRSVRAEATQTAYGISKCAVAMLTQSLAADLAGTGVRVFNYSPGRVRTDLTGAMYAAAEPKGQWTPMDKAVDGVVTVAQGRMDELAGLFLHADDAFEELLARSQEIASHGGRTLTLAEAYPGDPLMARIAGQRATGSRGTSDRGGLLGAEVVPAGSPGGPS
ncbi:MAG: short-chain dehydrogenase [Streptosporangiaceae bacterium]|nr:short-chain dehydrogenase [Streptosporangiaceae bacterium]